MQAKQAKKMSMYVKPLGLFTPGHFMRFLWSDIWLFVKTFAFTPGHINVSLQNWYKSVIQFPRYMQI